MNKPEVGVVGAGNVGGRIVRDLLAAGYAVHVADTSEAALHRVAEAGALPSDSPQDVARESDVILLSLPNSDVVDSVALGPGGVLDGIASGGIIVDMSTSLPARSIRLAEECGRRGIRMLDAPISFGAHGMDIMAGGPPELYDEVSPILDVVSHKATLVGPNGHGHFTKLAQNLISGANIAVVAEAVVYGMRAGLDLDRMWDSMRTTGAASSALERGMPEMVSREFGQGGQLALHAKDMAYLLETGADLGAPLPIAEIVHAAFKYALAHGDEKWSQRACVAYWEQGAPIPTADSNR